MDSVGERTTPALRPCRFSPDGWTERHTIGATVTTSDVIP
jgi:hypothetical protein